MKRKRIKAELLLPAAAPNRTTAPLATIAANPLEPFFRDSDTMTHFRRLQTVVEQRKWPAYFHDWGCLVCGTKNELHASLGMCRACYTRTQSRMQTTLKRAKKERPCEEPPRDLEQLAREALAPSLAILSADTRRKR